MARSDPEPIVGEREYINVARTTRILGVSTTTVCRLAASGLIDLVEYRMRRRKRVRYQSVVEFCTGLRERYAIPDRRPPSAPHIGRKDEDILPFPLTDTMWAAEALAVLGFRKLPPLVKLIKGKHFEAYQLVPGSPWRISRSSFTSFVLKARAGLQARGHAYRKIGPGCRL